MLKIGAYIALFEPLVPFGIPLVTGIRWRLRSTSIGLGERHTDWNPFCSYVLN